MSLLAATPAFAVDPFFKIHFVSGPTSSSNGPNGITGIQGVATYTFSETDIGEMTLNLDNISTRAGDSLIVGTGFDLPGPTSTPSFNPQIFVASSSTIQDWGITVGGTLNPPNQFGQFDICATTNEQNGNLGTCDGGATEFGVGKGLNEDVATFTFGGLPPLASATDYRNAFAGLFTTAPDNSFFMRFKGITGNPDSDKILATSVELSPDTPPPPAPGDEVPGPLPLLGAVAAFGYSRKLRRRMKVKSVIS
ncbi:hypothetical protein [Synechococcus sp. BA-132 BA5]|uniref:hypothetical protein n=1 Tax=Synechococcus sp. BA-132 BA5 TaxID=3110252 RepID=UPI002B1FF478|nr:hypothetical protein [Synechococcus sp. BA-132 BA5]MEA5414011.1 hypothetical protein [Synechococcus sp. BA-132 BA5]